MSAKKANKNLTEPLQKALSSLVLTICNGNSVESYNFYRDTSLIKHPVLNQSLYELNNFFYQSLQESRHLMKSVKTENYPKIIIRLATIF